MCARGAQLKDQCEYGSVAIKEVTQWRRSAQAEEFQMDFFIDPEMDKRLLCVGQEQEKNST